MSGQVSGQTSRLSINLGGTPGLPLKLDLRLSGALAELLKASQYAENCQRDRWEFSIRIKSLFRLGLSESDLRFLVCKGVVEHARECSSKSGKFRSFKPGSSLQFSKRTCFVLTAAGHKCVLDFLGRPSVDATEELAETLQKPQRRLVPRWDNGRHALFVDSFLVKRFRWPACNQEAVLNALEEELWPDGGVFDPLAPTCDKDPKQRLRDTTKCLNRHQENPFVRFRGDGTGERIIWEFTEEARHTFGLHATASAKENKASQRAG